MTDPDGRFFLVQYDQGPGTYPQTVGLLLIPKKDDVPKAKRAAYSLYRRYRRQYRLYVAESNGYYANYCTKEQDALWMLEESMKEELEKLLKKEKVAFYWVNMKVMRVGGIRD